MNFSSSGIVDIEMLFEIEYKYPLHTLFIHPYMGSWFTGICEELLDNREREVD